MRDRDCNALWLKWSNKTDKYNISHVSVNWGSSGNDIKMVEGLPVVLYIWQEQVDKFLHFEHFLYLVSAENKEEKNKYKKYAQH